MAKHYKQSKRSSDKMKKAHNPTMAMPPDAAEAMGEESQLYHMGQKYYGEGYGHFANLPPKEQMYAYPKPRSGLDTDRYPDTLKEIDADHLYNMKKVEQYPSDSMY